MDACAASMFLCPVAPLWRRILANLVDIIFLVLLGNGFALLLPDFCYAMGQTGVFFGFFVICLYFGLMDSSVGNGQSLGKLLFRIAVRDASGKTLGGSLAILRAAIFYLPCLHFSSPPGFDVPISFLSWWIVALGPLVLCPILLCRSRQGLHDMVCNTYVVNLKGTQQQEIYPRTGFTPVLISFILAVFVPFLFLPCMMCVHHESPEAAKLRSLVESKPEVIKAIVYESDDRQDKLMPDGAMLRIWCKGRPSPEQRKMLANYIEDSAVRYFDDDHQYGILTLVFESCYDIIFAKGSTLKTDVKLLPAHERMLLKLIKKRMDSAEPKDSPLHETIIRAK